MAIGDRFSIKVVCSAFDLKEPQPLTGVRINQWNEVQLPGTTVPIQVWYAGKGEPSLKTWRQLLREKRPSKVYINGMFSLPFVLYPLMRASKNSIVLSPRGMLQKGALAQKPVKKRIYLSVMRSAGFLQSIHWHATNEEERDDIAQLMPDPTVTVIGNIPRKPVPALAPSAKKIGALKLVYLSLITAKKNLLLLLEWLQDAPPGVRLDVYGPIKDQPYWNACDRLMQSNPDRFQYKGDVPPDQVQSIFQQYDAFAFLTKGENFGHALYECLSAGRPILTSRFTPWNDLTTKGAGWNVELEDKQAFLALLDRLLRQDATDFHQYNQAAHQLASDYYRDEVNANAYVTLFAS